MYARLLSTAQDNIDSLIHDVNALVDAESYSYDKDKLSTCAEVLLKIVRTRLGEPDEFTRHTDKAYGDTFCLTYEGDNEKNMLFVGHYDTVWPTGTLADWPDREATDASGRRTLTGPGIFDMKTGVIQAIWATKLLRDSGESSPTIHLLFNGDEEVGSQFSQSIIEESAREMDAALVFEATLDGKIKVQRKGVGIITATAKGIEAHAGLNPQDGASAVHALMEWGSSAVKLANPTAGTTVNVGTFHGGTGTNVAAGTATAMVDIRLNSTRELERLDKELDEIDWSDSRVDISLTKDWNRPPMEFTEQSKNLFSVLQNSAQQLGREIEAASVGGASDANFISALNIPVLCGVGAVGSGAHARDEYIYPDEIPFFTALAAAVALNF
ncbi:MAG: M20/M25/M40 family metallo-hydrolase [Corynebacterium sp.]|nr:M20/M25/M40 family metallo-hydrolase [Corynebacterium sp.]